MYEDLELGWTWGQNIPSIYSVLGKACPVQLSCWIESNGTQFHYLLRSSCLKQFQLSNNVSVVQVHPLILCPDIEATRRQIIFWLRNTMPREGRIYLLCPEKRNMYNTWMSNYTCPPTQIVQNIWFEELLHVSCSSGPPKWGNKCRRKCKTKYYNPAKTIYWSPMYLNQCNCTQNQGRAKMHSLSPAPQITCLPL